MSGSKINYILFRYVKYCSYYYMCAMERIQKTLNMKNLEKALINYLADEFETLNGRTIVATPESRENLEAFAKANQGCMDLVLTQMAIQYGYKIALQNLQTKFLLTEK